MRIVLSIIGVLVTLMGVVWFLQGINILPGSFMTGQSQWAIYGAISSDQRGWAAGICQPAGGRMKM